MKRLRKFSFVSWNIILPLSAFQGTFIEDINFLGLGRSGFVVLDGRLCCDRLLVGSKKGGSVQTVFVHECVGRARAKEGVGVIIVYNNLIWFLLFL